MANNYCPTCQHEKNSIGFCDKCLYSRLLEEKGIAPTMYERRPTNADHIRAMSDEELARFRAYGDCPENRYMNDYECDYFHGDCEKCWLDWLKEEANNG